MKPEICPDLNYKILLQRKLGGSNKSDLLTPRFQKTSKGKGKGLDRSRNEEADEVGEASDLEVRSSANLYLYFGFLCRPVLCFLLVRYTIILLLLLLKPKSKCDNENRKLTQIMIPRFLWDLRRSGKEKAFQFWQRYTSFICNIGCLINV